MNPNIPLAEKLRPKTLDEVLGQEHLTGDNGTIRKMLENDTLNSLILWGPPGTGKTTLAEIISFKDLVEIKYFAGDYILKDKNQSITIVKSEIGKNQLEDFENMWNEVKSTFENSTQS